MSADQDSERRMLSKVLARFPVERVILVADRGLLSLDNIAELSTWPDERAQAGNSSLAVPARRYAELGGTLEAMDFSTGLAEGQFRRAAPGGRPRSDSRGRALGATRKTHRGWKSSPKGTGHKLDAQDEGKSERGHPRHRPQRHSRFQRASRTPNDPLRESRLSDGSASASMRKPLLAPSASTANWFWSQRHRPLSERDRDALQEPGGHRTGLPGAQSDLDRARIPPPARSHPRPRADLLPRSGLYRVMRMRLKASGSSAGRTGAGDASPHPEAPRHHWRACLPHRHQQDHPGAT